VLAHIITALENPFVAAALGLLGAFLLLWASRSSFRRIQPDTAPIDMAIAAVSLFARLAAATIVMWAYKTYLTPGFKPFAFSLAGGFVVMYTLELVRYAGLKRYSRPANQSGK
jgi:hypothetical protein